MIDLGGDIKLVPKGIASETLGPADIELLSGATDLTRDAGLETVVTIAVFTNASANDDDILPDNDDTRGGHFSEIILGDKFGSRLWLLRRSNLTQETLNKATEYIEESLDRHIVNEGIAKGHTVTVTKVDKYAKIKIELEALDNQTLLYEYYLNWQRQTGRI